MAVLGSLNLLSLCSPLTLPEEEVVGAAHFAVVSGLLCSRWFALLFGGGVRRSPEEVGFWRGCLSKSGTSAQTARLRAPCVAQGWRRLEAPENPWRPLEAPGGPWRPLEAPGLTKYYQFKKTVIKLVLHL